VPKGDSASLGALAARPNRPGEAGLAAANTVKGLVIDDAHPADVRLVNFGDNSLDFELVAWVGADGVGRPGGIQSRFLWALETELTQRGIEIPFPKRDLHIRSGKLPVEMAGPAPAAPS